MENQFIHVYFILSSKIERKGMKKRKKWIFIILVPLVIISFIFIKNRMQNNQFYQFEKKLKTEMSYIDKIDIGNYGPYCSLYIYIDEDSCNYENIEKTFIRIMVEVSSKENFQYFLERHNKNASGELAFFNVAFYEEGVKDKVLYKYTSYKDFQVWELESDRSIQFNSADYVK